MGPQVNIAQFNLVYALGTRLSTDNIAYKIKSSLLEI